MRKGKSVLGLKVISQSDAANLGTVRDLIFDHQSDELLALLVSDKDLFGLIDAQIVPWGEVINIGQDAVMVKAAASKIQAGADERVKDVLNRQTALSGTRIMTSDGKALGTLADTYIDDATGRVVGYEVSGGFFSDTISGKQFLPAVGNLTVGANNVVVVPAEAAAHLESKQQHDDTLKKTVSSVSEKVSGVYDTAKEKLADSYFNVSTATTEKQKAFVIGKTAGRDVMLPAEKLPPQTSTTGTPANGTEPVSELSSATVWDLEAPVEPTIPASPAESENWDQVVDDEILVHKGEVITAVHADQADAAGILHQLLIAAGAGTASNIAASSSEHVSNLGSTVAAHARNAVVGRQAGRLVRALDGSVLVAVGDIITAEVYDQAYAEGKDTELTASAGVAAVAHGAEVVKEQAASLWESLKHKAEELTGAGHHEQNEAGNPEEQDRIKHALGLPVSHAIKDRNDGVVMYFGELVTPAAIQKAREAGVLDAVLDSVYASDAPVPHPTPHENEPGGDAAHTKIAQPGNGMAIPMPAAGASTQLVHSEATPGEIVRDESSNGSL